jgi:hypothetical protein
MRKATFLDIYYFLEDEDRRDEIRAGLTTQKHINYWNNPKNLPTGENRFRIISRLTDFVNSTRLTQIFDAPNPKFNVTEAIKNRQIILVKLGDLTPTQSIYATSFDRNSEVDDPDIIPFFLYCDEFQKFQTSDFPDLLSRAGGLGLALKLANQYPDQLTSEIINAILGTTSNFVLFHMSKKNAAHFNGEFPKPEPGKYSWDPGIPDYLAMAPYLLVGQAVFKLASGDYGKIDTLDPRKLKKAEINYAEYITNRTVQTTLAIP